MIKDLSDLKALISWAKKERVKSLELDGVKFELSDLAFIGDFNEADASDKLETAVDESKFENEQQNSQDEDDLYWSS